MTYCVYILRCSDNSLYTGYTKDLEKRIQQHNGERIGGARYTRAHRPVKVVHCEMFETKREAMQREFEIKELNHEGKEALIKNQ